MMTLEDQLIEDVDAILGAGGLIAQGDGTLRYSRLQHEYAIRVAKGFTRYDQDNGRTAINMQQAGTGTGKTLGYLVPLLLFAARTGARVGVSTFTRHLQRQIKDDDAKIAVDWVKQRTGVGLDVRLRMGIGNFASATFAARHRDLLRKEDPERYGVAVDFLDGLIRWLGEEDKNGLPLQSGILDEYLETEGVETLPEGVQRKRIVLTRHAPERERLAYNAMVSASKGADVLVVNHALLVLNAHRWASLLDDEDLRRLSVVVCDEADRLPSAAESILQDGLSLHELASACKAVDLPQVGEAADALYKYVQTLKVPDLEAAAVGGTSGLAEKISPALAVLQPAAVLGARLMKTPTTDMDIDKADRLSDFIDQVSRLVEVKEAIGQAGNNAVVSWSPVRAFPSLHVGRPNPARVLAHLWSIPRSDEDDLIPPRGYLDAVMFTSATLDDPDRPLPQAFDDFAASVGVIRHARRDGVGGGMPIHNVCTDLFDRVAPAKFGSMSFVLADPAAPSPTMRDDDDMAITDPEWLDYAAQMIRAAAASGKKTLVLALSWRDTNDINSRLNGLPGLVCHRAGHPLQEALDAYKKQDGAVLVSPGAWEGVSLKGQVGNLVITRIPYSPPNSAKALLRRVSLEALGFAKDKINSIQYALAESDTRRKLAQGIGRGIRQPDDSVVLWIADPRFPQPESFADSLDDVLLAPSNHHARASLRSCIPPRFRETSFQRAEIWLKSGVRHTPLGLEA